MIEYISGDNITQRATLYTDIDNKITLSIIDDYVFEAFIADYKRNKVVITSGAVNVIDSANGVIEIVFSSAQTEILKSYDGDILWLVVKLALGTKKTTFKQRFKAVKIPF